MRCWTTSLDFARQWQAAEKIVYSRTRAEPRSARTKIEGSFDPDGVRKLKANVASDIAVAGPERAAQAIQAGLVDEFQCLSAQWSLAAENGTSRVVCGWIWSWSSSGRSATARSFCGMQSAASRREGWNVTRQA